MRSEDEIKKGCINCLYFDIETIYGVCDKHGILNDVVKNCEDYEEELNEQN